MRQAKNSAKVIETRYYRGRLWKITTRVRAIYNQSVYASNNTRFVKHYFRRSAVGSDWEYVRSSVQDGAPAFGV